VPLWALAAVAVGVAVVAVGLTHVWDGTRAEQAKQARAAVAIEVTVPAARDPLVGWSAGHHFEYSATMHVTNTGPRPIDLGPVSGAAAGLIMRRNDLAHSFVAPGRATDVPVDLSVDCRDWVRGTPVELQVSVRTADGVQRSSLRRVTTYGTDWDKICTPF
jgi:hypothetical protein